MNKEKNLPMAQEMLSTSLGPFLCPSSYGAISIACAFHSYLILIVTLVMRHCHFCHVMSLFIPIPVPVVILLWLFLLSCCSCPCHWSLSPSPHCCCHCGSPSFFSLHPPHLCHASCSFPPHKYVLVAVEWVWVSCLGTILW